jgi:hypothetical protein
MNIFEWDKEKWEDFKDSWDETIFFLAAPLALGEVIFFLWLVFLTVFLILVFFPLLVLYLLIRLLRYSYLFITGQLWKSGNRYWALPAMKRIKKQKKLKKVVIEAQLENICEAAWEKITDFEQEFLKEVAIKASDSDVCEAAVERITDQEFLKEIAIKASDSDVRKAAVERITDQKFLKDRAIKDSDMDVRIESAYKLYMLSGNDDSLKLIIRKLSNNLRNGFIAKRRRCSALHLHHIYNKYPISSIRDSISVLNGTVIKRHSDSSNHSDYMQPDCDGSIHIDSMFGNHTDIPEELFHV